MNSNKENSLKNDGPLKIYLGDLTYDTVTISAESMPLNIGYVAAYCKKQFGDDFIAADLREVKGAEGMATETGGLDMMSPAFNARVTPDDNMNMFNSVQEKNRTLQQGQSGSTTIMNTTNAQSTNTKQGDLIASIPSPVRGKTVPQHLQSR